MKILILCVLVAFAFCDDCDCDRHSDKSCQSIKIQEPCKPCIPRPEVSISSPKPPCIDISVPCIPKIEGKSCSTCKCKKSSDKSYKWSEKPWSMRGSKKCNSKKSHKKSCKSHKKHRHSHKSHCKK